MLAKTGYLPFLAETIDKLPWYFGKQEQPIAILPGKCAEKFPSAG